MTSHVEDSGSEVIGANSLFDMISRKIIVLDDQMSLIIQ